MVNRLVKRSISIDIAPQGFDLARELAGGSFAGFLSCSVLEVHMFEKMREPSLGGRLIGTPYFVPPIGRSHRTFIMLEDDWHSIREFVLFRSVKFRHIRPRLQHFVRWPNA